MSPLAKSIPDDVVFSILSKLPLKSLKRFICIHKSLALLLENSYFMSMFRNNFISKFHSYYYDDDDDDDTPLVLLQPGDDIHAPHCMMYLLSGDKFQNRIKLDWPPPFQEDSRYVAIVGSAVHGTLCLQQGSGKLVLWNPASEVFEIIPPSPVESLPYMDIMTTLHGFGYDHVTDDYKLIRHICFFQYLTDFEGDMEGVPSSPDYSWEIYSLRSNSWRALDIDMRHTYGHDNNIYMNGACHWLCAPNERTDEGCLVSFEFSNESSFTTTLPLDLCDELIINRLVVLNGSIAVISNYYETTSFQVSILGELGGKESWTKLFTFGPLPCVEHPIGTGKNGDIFFIKKDEEVVWFDLSTMMIQEIGLKGKLHYTQIVIYRENLLRLSK